MLFNTIQAAIILSPDKLQFISLKKNQPSVPPLQFPNEAVVHQEIVNEKLLFDSINTYLRTQNTAPQEVAILLSSQLVYMQRIPQDTQNIDQQINTFYEAIPVDSGKISKKQFTYNKETILTGTNKRFYEITVQVLEELGWKVAYIVPATFFMSKEQESTIIGSSLNKILSNTKFLKISNFLDETSEHVHTAPNSESILLVTIIVILLFLNGYVLGLVLGKISVPEGFLALTRSKKQLIAPSPIPQPKRIPTIQKESSIEAKIQKDLKIKILNGSGIAGLAASVSATLKEAGFTDIETGNSGTLRPYTLIETADDVEASTIAAVSNILSQLFEEVTTQSAALDRDIQMQITTGLRKE